MTQREMLEVIEDTEHWTAKAKEHARNGNLPGAYTCIALARDSLHQGIRDYSNAKQESEAAS